MSAGEVAAGLEAILAGRTPPAVFEWDGADPAPVVRRTVEDAGWRFAAVDGATKEALLVELADQLRFPAWFGHNLDALEECLAALDEPTFVLWEEWGALLEAEPGTFATVLEVLGDRARAAEPTPSFAVAMRVPEAAS